jgi:preprotein translocase SecE subunit
MSKTSATAAPVAATPKTPSAKRFFGGIGAELKKVVWLSRREVGCLTGVVILVTVVAGAVLGGLDAGFSRLVGTFFGG